MPLLLVKRYAFDVELLAVSARSATDGSRRCRSRSTTGSPDRASARWPSLHALVDTLAVFYRLRILGFYQRRAASLRHFAWNVESDGIMPLVTAIDASGDTATRRIEAEEADRRDPRLHRARRASVGELALVDVAVLRPLRDRGSRHPAALTVGRRRRGSEAAAAIGESRLGSGSLNFRFKPGSIRLHARLPGALVSRSPRQLSWRSTPRRPRSRSCFELDRRGRPDALPARRVRDDAARTALPLPSPAHRGIRPLARPCGADPGSARALGLSTLATVALLALGRGRVAPRRGRTGGRLDRRLGGLCRRDRARGVLRRPAVPFGQGRDPDRRWARAHALRVRAAVRVRPRRPTARQPGRREHGATSTSRLLRPANRL